MNKKMILIGILIVIAIFSIYRFAILQPSQNRTWAIDQQVLAHADIADNLITIHDIRNFVYRTESDYTPGYYDKTFDLEKIKAVRYAVVPFGSIPGVAHAFVSFEFEGDQFVAISIEVRKQVGESYSMLRSIVQPYELRYVVGDENDIIKLRTNYREGEKVFFYPIKADKEALKAVFMDYIRRVNSLSEKPEFYDLFTNTCTTEIVDTVNRVTSFHIPLSYKYFLPAFSDEYALEVGLLDTDLPIEKARERFYINDRAKAYGDGPDFSLEIRK